MEFLLVVALVVVIVFYRRRSGQIDVGTMVRRLVEYGFLLGLTVITGFGVAGVLARVVGEVGPGSSGGTETMALWLTFVLVGGASLTGLALWIRRRFTTDPSEEAAAGWSLYVAAAELASMGGMVVSSVGTLSWIIADSGFHDFWIAHLVVWSAVWAFHWRLGSRTTSTGAVRTQVHLLIGAAVGMVGLAVSASFVIGHLLNWAYDGSMPDYIPDYRFDVDSATWGSTVDGVRGAIPALLTFAAAWFWYWWRNARRTRDSVERHAFVLVGGVLGGLGATVVASSGLLFTILLWFLADQDGTSATEHFDVTPVFLTVLLVGMALWAYHRSELPRNDRRSDVERTYDHLAAWVGLIAATAGAAVFLGAVVLHRILPNPHDWDESLGEPMAGVITLLAVGGTVWWRNWSRIQGHASEPGEQVSPVRRIYLLTVFGSTALIVLVSVLVMVFMVIYGLLEQDLGADEIAWFRIPLALVGSTVGVAVYHGRVLRQGLRAVPAESRPKAVHITLVAHEGAGLAEALAERTGAHVSLLTRADGMAGQAWGDPALEDLVGAVRAAGQTRLLIVVATDGTFELVPVTEG